MIRKLILSFYLVILLVSITGFTRHSNYFNAPAERNGARAFLIENQGQYQKDVRFVHQSSQGINWFTEQAIWFSILESDIQNVLHPGQISGNHIKLSFPGANPNVQIKPFNPYEVRVSFLTGGESDDWYPDVPVWGGLRYVNLYPGIDLILKPKEMGEARFDWFFEADKSADPSVIRLRLEGIQDISRDGYQLDLITDIGELSVSLPSIIKSDKSNAMRLAELSSEFSVDQTGTQTFEVNHTFSQRELLVVQPRQVISNALSYSTYLGGNDWEDAYGLAVDSFGYAYVTGRTPSLDFPVTPGAFQTDSHGVDVFVAKLLPDGTGLEYATFIGGSGQDSAFGIAVEDGIAYVVGNTWSSDFPMAGELAGENDAFVFALNPTGTDLLYSTLLGGEDQDFGNAIAVESGDVFLTGTTLSQDFPAEGYQRLGDAFVARLDGEGEPRYVSILGGREDEAGFGIAVQSGEVFVTGQTWSLDFPASGFKGNGDAFIAGFDPDGERLFASLVAGVGDDRGTGIVVDADGNSIISGSTSSPDFPTSPGEYRGGQDAFLASFNQDGEIQSTTLFGGSRDDSASGLAWDGSGGIYTTGRTDSTNLPVSQGAYQSLLAGGYDVFLAHFRLSDGFEKIEATYIGGSANDQAQAVASDVVGNVYLAGSTESGDFPISDGAHSLTLKGSQDAFVSRFGSAPLSSPQPTSSPTSQVPTSQSTSTPLATLPIIQTTVTVTSLATQVSNTPLPDETQQPGQPRETVRTQVEVPTSTPGPNVPSELAPTITSEASFEGETTIEVPPISEKKTDIKDAPDTSNYTWLILPIVLLLVFGLLFVYRKRTIK